MDDDTEVDAYASAAAQSYLARIDGTFVEHVARLLAPAEPVAGRALDLGCGPGQITIMLARRWPSLRFTAIDAARAMIDQARRDAASAGVDIDFEVFRLGPDGHPRLPYEDGAFELVTCNSVLHHLADPLGALNEMARVCRPGGAVLLRDLRRPSPIAYPAHVRLYGRHYSGEMRRLYEASVRAAYGLPELRALLEGSALNDGRSRVFRKGRVHQGIERSAAPRTA